MRTARATSAGGVILEEPRPDAKVVLVARRLARGGLQWILPKGTVEAGESLLETALREAREESGLEVALIGELDTIDYWFVQASEQTRYHKFVHYFLMHVVGGDLSLHDDEVEQARWFTIAQAREAMAFANERRLLDRIPAVLDDWSRTG